MFWRKRQQPEPPPAAAEASVEQMSERRSSYRDDTLEASITAFAERRDGVVLEGVTKDYSETGARIVGDITGLTKGEYITLTLVVLGDQKVQYKAEVVRIHEDAEEFGVRFLTPPHRVEEKRVRRKSCNRCARYFPSAWKYCALCGYELVWDL